MLPNKSQGSMKNGYWFIFEDEENIIRVWGSSKSGKEKVYFNDELVSEHRSYKFKNKHTFSDNKNNSYIANFNVTSMLKGHIECNLSKNNSIIKEISAKYQFNFLAMVVQMLSMIVLIRLIKFITPSLGLPPTISLFGMMLIFGLFIKFHKKPKIVFDDVDG